MACGSSARLPSRSEEWELKSFRLVGYLGLLTAVCTGCGPTATSGENSPDVESAVSAATAGEQTVTFRVSEMGKRLKLL